MPELFDFPVSLTEPEPWVPAFNCCPEGLAHLEAYLVKWPNLLGGHWVLQLIEPEVMDFSAEGILDTL